MAVFGGHVALAQLADGLDFLLEQPQRSWLHEVAPWPEVKRHARTAVEITDQCQSGARTSKGEAYRKPTELWSSDEVMLEPFRGLRCGAIPEACSGKHVQGGLGGNLTKPAQVWPWRFAERVAEGCANVLAKRDWQNGTNAMYFPETGTEPLSRKEQRDAST